MCIRDRSYIDFMGAAAFVDLARRLEVRHGPRFRVPDTLAAMAERGGTFYADAEKRAA